MKNLLLLSVTFLSRFSMAKENSMLRLGNQSLLADHLPFATFYSSKRRWRSSSIALATFSYSASFSSLYFYIDLTLSNFCLTVRVVLVAEETIERVILSAVENTFVNLLASYLRFPASRKSSSVPSLVSCVGFTLSILFTKSSSSYSSSSSSISENYYCCLLWPLTRGF